MIHSPWKDIPVLLKTPLGRSELIHGIWHRSWPVLSRLAVLYRTTIVRNTRVVAVVGSFGKSTTARAIAAALGVYTHPRFQFNAFSSVARAVLRIRPHDRHAVIEVGINGPGQMEVYARLVKPDITVVTSIGSEHNRSLGTLEATRTEKSKMVRALKPSGTAVLNGDDPNVLWMKNQTVGKVITFGIDRTNDIWASDINLDWPNGTRFKLHALEETRDLRIRLIGRHMVYPILASVAVSLAWGFTLDQVIPALEALDPTPGRMQPVLLPNGAFILRDDYKSHLETIEIGLDILAEIPARRRIVLLGDIEEPPGKKYPLYQLIGERIAKVASRAIFVGGHSCRKYATGAKHGGMPQESISYIGENTLKAAELLRQEIGPGDVVLIKGRGTQRLDRVALSLMGKTVRCRINYCNVKGRCEHCPMLERGWNDPFITPN